MPQSPVSTPLLATDPGFLFWAPIGTAEPTHAVTASQFSDAWPAAWIRLGATEEGHTFNWQTSFDPVTVAELLDPVKYITTGRTGSLAFALVDFHMNNVKRALNGGTITTTGATTTTLSTYTPAAQGAEVRAMIGWESQDATERLIAYQTVNTAQVSIARRKGSDNANLPVEFQLEAPATGLPFKYLTAGVARLGV
jgi:hypothetical protein